MTYSEKSIEMVFQKLVSSDKNLATFYEHYLAGEYADKVFDERMYYYDIARIAEFINKMFLARQTDNFPDLFKNIEEILTNSDQCIKDLLIAGLFEDMQNTSDIHYYTSFDEWLQPQTKMVWNELIKFWEGNKRQKRRKRNKTKR